MQSDNNVNPYITPSIHNPNDNTQQIDGSWLRLIYVALKEQDLPADSLFSTAGIAVNNLHELEFVSRHTVINLYKHIDNYNGLDLLPISIANIFQLYFLRYTGTIISDAKSVNDLLKKIIYASTRMYEMVKIETRVERQFTYMIMTSRVEVMKVHQTSLEIGICIIHKMVNQLFPFIPDLVVNITLDLKSKRTRFEEVFNCPVSYHDSNEYIMVFNNDLLNTPNIFSTHSKSLEQLVDAGCSKTDLKIFTDIERLIIENIATKDLNIIFIAAKMNVSVKTLQRQLKRFNTNFSTLLKSNKMKYALNLLRAKKLSLTQIASELGFNSASSFSRAFKKWTGISPSDYQ